MNTSNTRNMDLNYFITDFKKSLLHNLSLSNPPIYHPDDMSFERQSIMDSLKRRPYSAQANVVQAVTKLLVDQDEPAAIINAEMGTGKTMMAIAVAAVLHYEVDFRRTLIISPPHLVYKWRREILETLPNARVWVLNGPDTIVKLLKLRQELKLGITSQVPEFYVLGRVRMRMGYHWRHALKSRPVYRKHNIHDSHGETITKYTRIEYAACPDCYNICMQDGEPILFHDYVHREKRGCCIKCGSALWTLIRPSKTNSSFRDRIKKSMCQIPTIGPVRAESLIDKFGEDVLSEMLEDNALDFVNLMDESGDFIFTDKQSRRMERALAKLEFGFGEGNYQATEFIKRYLPNGFFDLLIVDEGHEYKNHGSAQGQAMGVLASQVKKILLLTGTLMGGYADDLFFLLFRVLTSKMIEDGYKPSRGSLGASALRFMQDHGIIKDIYTERHENSHKTAQGNNISHKTQKAPGFGPKGILRYILPYTVFLKLKDLNENVLPQYTEKYVDIPMSDEQRSYYDQLSDTLNSELRKALVKRDITLIGVVLNTLLAWPDCCFRAETVTHPKTQRTIAFVPSIFSNDNLGDLSPKELALVEHCITEKSRNRKVLVYATYTGTRDITERLKLILEQSGLKTAVLKSSVSPEKREDWLFDKVDRNYDVIITNPELVKTGLDLLDFPTIIFLQTGFNVYTLQQAAKRSFRIGQKNEVTVIFLGYERSAQTSCLELMAKKIAVCQSTSGDMPESGLDILNVEEDSIEMALAKQLISA